MDILPKLEKDDSVRIEKQVKQQQEYKLVNKVRRNAGHILFSYNTVIKELKRAEFSLECVIVNLVPITKTKVIKERDCIYFQALNEKNAWKVIRRDYKV